MASRPPRPTRPPPETPDSSSSTATSSSPATLTPLRAHYLKKSLVQLQLRRELDDLTSAPADNASTLAYLGPPFSPPQSRSSRLDLPFLKYIFRHFVLSFPFLAAAPNDFFSDKLQPFVANAFSRNLSPSINIDESDPSDSPDATRLKLLAKVERNLSMLIASAIKLIEPEDVLRLSQSDLQSLERAVNKRLAKRKTDTDVFNVNIVSVRSVTDRSRVRSRVHDEFIIRTILSQDRRVCVSRRYGDFKTLAEELRKAYPDAIVPSPPAKDRTAVDVPMSQPISSPMSDIFPNGDASSESLGQYPPVPGSYYSATSPPPSSYPSSPTPPRLSREKNRLTLRAYLHTLLATPPFSSSPVLRSFLLSGPTRLTPEEEEDARHREEADRVREEGKKKFAKEIGARVDRLRDAVRTVKGEIVGRDGLTHVFATIKVTPHVRQLPRNYQAVLEWARISLASTIFKTFVASDNSSETFASLKRIHGLMPYFLLKAALKISNPVAMMRAVLDIFLAQPFGGRSLLQRMFSSSLTEEVKSLNTYIELVSAKIDSPIMCEKIRLFVYAPREIQEMYRMDAKAENTHLLRIVLMGGEEPVLSRSLVERIERSWRKWEKWMAEKERARKGRGKGGRGESDSDEEGPDDEEAWLFEDLKVLVKLYLRLRDREQLIALIFEGITAELLKDIITIFYAPLAQVYRAASIADSLGDLQNFINDLIRTVEQTEDLSQSDPSLTVQAFIDLVNRHEQSFYSFVHKVHSKDQGLFNSLMHWVERFLTVVREGVGASTTGEAKKIALETLLPAGGEERVKIMAEVDEVMRWHYLNKIAHEEKVRRRFGRAQKGGGVNTDAEEEAAQALLDGVAKGFDFGELVRANADELAAEESDDEYDDEDEDDSEDDDDSDEDSSEYETDSDDTEEEMTVRKNMPEKPPVSIPSSSRSTHSPTIHPAPSRSQTIQAVSQPVPQAVPTLSRSQTSPSPRTPVGRQRSQSLHGAKSIGASVNPHPQGDVPPVPRLPRLLVQHNKPLSPNPTGPSSAGVRRTHSLSLTDERGTGDDPHPPPAPRPPQKSKRKVTVAMQPPELKHIPTLLPVFVEMMRPLLRPQP